MVRSVALAFQGGGAKVISLIAAADAISELVADGLIKIEEISGTSAGSLAALLLSSQVDFTKVKSAIQNQEKSIEKRFPKPGKTAAFTKIATFLALGNTLYSVRKFNKMLEEILFEVGIDINKQLSEVTKTPLTIIASDILNAKSVPFQDGPLRDLLRRSCAIPFIFGSFRSEDHGQYADGGIFDNLPTEVLINHLGSDMPVFAIGFQSEKVKTPENSFEYITSIVGSIVTNNVSRSCEHIGDEYVCPIETSLGTLDFDKMISVGVNKEYDNIKKSAKEYFNKWLNGETSVSIKNTPKRASSKLTEVERKIISHVNAAFRAVPGQHEYVKMSVTANSLAHEKSADDIIVEQLLLLPPGYSLHGTVIPLIDGSGSPDRLDCVVKMDGPDGEDVPFTQFLIDNEPNVDGNLQVRNNLAILFSDNIVSSNERKLYIAKKETRFGFMSPLRRGQDELALTSAFWPAKLIEIHLSVPAEYAGIQRVWASRGSNNPYKEAPEKDDFPKFKWRTFAATLADVQKGGQLKGFFTPKKLG